MKYRYAEINGAGVVVSDFETTKETVKNTLIAVDPGADSPLGKKWDGSAFVDAPVVHDGAPNYPRATKTEFRRLLTQAQKLVWDNYDLLKTELGLSDAQYMALRTFRQDFEMAAEVDFTDAVLIAGLNTISGWDLTYGGGDLFPAGEVERILDGRRPA